MLDNTEVLYVTRQKNAQLVCRAICTVLLPTISLQMPLVMQRITTYADQLSNEVASGECFPVYRQHHAAVWCTNSLSCFCLLEVVILQPRAGNYHVVFVYRLGKLGVKEEINSQIQQRGISFSRPEYGDNAVFLMIDVSSFVSCIRCKLLTLRFIPFGFANPAFLMPLLYFLFQPPLQRGELSG